jgi:hypothetical protein
MKMLLYKAWVETRVRFFASLVAVTIICVFYAQQHAWLVTMWAQDLLDTKGYHTSNEVLGIQSYGWYREKIWCIQHKTLVFIRYSLYRLAIKTLSRFLRCKRNW